LIDHLDRLTLKVTAWVNYTGLEIVFLVLLNRRKERTPVETLCATGTASVFCFEEAGSIVLAKNPIGRVGMNHDWQIKGDRFG